MGLFSTILDKLGLHKGDAAKPAAAASTPATPAASTPATPKPQAASNLAPASMPAAPAGAAKPAATPMAEVDVVKKLDGLASGSGLDWKVSIVDLLKLLKMDSSLESRKQLATELGCPPDLMGGDSAKMNVWLHKTVLAKIAENGGNIPQELFK